MRLENCLACRDDISTLPLFLRFEFYMPVIAAVGVAPTLKLWPAIPEQ